MLSAQVRPGVVREVILASWERSRRWQVDADRFTLPYQPDPDRESLLVYGARSVIPAIAEQFANEPVSVILTDATGLVLERRTGDSPLRRKLDQVWLAPGFNYAERFAGTNGIGTALECRGPAQVFGHEHYAEHLEDLACAGVPVRHPVTGQVLGLVDLTCWSEDANPTMVAAAASIARQIEDVLLAHCGHGERALLQHYLDACRRGEGATLAVSHDLVMSNDSARRLLDPSDQAALLERANEALATGRPQVLTTVLPSGSTVRVHCQPSWSESGRVGGVLAVHMLDNLVSPRPALVAGGAGHPAGAVGSSAVWTQCCREVEAHFRAGRWLVLEGEPGVGKLTLARCTHLNCAPSTHLRVFDATDCDDLERWISDLTEELAGPGGTLILRRVHRLPAEALPRLIDVLGRVQRGPDGPAWWVAATRNSPGGAQGSAGNGDGQSAQLMRYFPYVVPVPPLRHRPEDLPELVNHLLSRLARGRDLSASSAAIQVLMRNQWPGNVTGLLGALRKAVARRPSGVIEPADLPAECRTIARRVLSRLEAIERDAIVETLVQAGGDRTEAARQLGMSRATIYRKIHYYGIDLPRTPPQADT